MIGTERVGIIDIGSNSIRLVIYENNGFGAYRVIDEAKEAARLSEHIDENGDLPGSVIESLSGTLYHFTMLCRAAGTTEIRAVATAAIRSAKHSARIVDTLQQNTGLTIQVLSGKDEAYLGFLGLINTMDARNGFLIDIGGGSTELTLFLNRRIVHTVSFPFGAVRLTKLYGQDGNLPPDKQYAIQTLVEKAAARHEWISRYPDLPLYGLGGTIRSLSNIDMRRKKYSLPITHNYRMSGSNMDDIINLICSVPVPERKNIEGLSKHRSDIILPGAIILRTLFRYCRASHYIVSGSSLRDGLFFRGLPQPELAEGEVTDHSVRNLLRLHPTVPIPHVKQVNRLALKLFDSLGPHRQAAEDFRQILHAASMLYRIGISINFYDFDKHTFYLIAHSRLNGLTHREILLCAMIASYRNKKRARQLLARHADLLSKNDLPVVSRLGSLLQLAIALDRSETQPVQLLEVSVRRRELQLRATTKDGLLIEARQVESLARDFQKEWRLFPVLYANDMRVTSSRT